MKVLLLFPQTTVNKQSVKKCDMPLGIAYIAAYLEKEGHDVRVLDISAEGYENETYRSQTVTFGLADNEVVSRIKEASPELVGISCSYSLQFHNLVAASKLVKQAGDIPVIAGGIHPSFDPQGVLNNAETIDYIGIGEGEGIIADLANGRAVEDIEGLVWRQAGKIVINKARQLIENIDALPFPARHLFDMEKYIKINKPHNHFPKKDRVASIITSRGCYGKCTFCSSTAFWKNSFRVRSADNVIKEMKALVEEYGVGEIQILDDNLTGIKERAKELFKKMAGLNIVWCTPNGVRIDMIDREMLELMKQSGCYRLTYAIESGDQYILENMIKKPLKLEKIKPMVDMTKKAGIGIHTYWIIGFPGETKEQMRRTYDLAKSLKTESSSVCLATPMVGTELLEICKKQGLLRQWYDPTKANYRRAEIKNPHISYEEMEKLCDFFNDSINMGLLWRNPVHFFKKYYKALLKNPVAITNIFKKFT